MSRFQRAIIVGASSGMGAELARELAAQGCRLGLVARRETELARLAERISRGRWTSLERHGEDVTDKAPAATPSVYNDVDSMLSYSSGGMSTANTSLPPNVIICPHDVHDYAAVPALFQTLCHDLGGLDLFIYAAGVMPRISAEEYSFEKDEQTIEVNVLGAMAWCNQAAHRFASTKGGTLVGIGSVAGDRGRRGNPAYSASKAALETYLEALRNRTGQYGVKVVTIKPGPVSTPMTDGLSMPMMIPADVAAQQILKAAERGKRVAYVPGQWRYIMGIIRAIPSPIFQKMNF
jgi:short-subunit dehydrogenase